MKTRVELDQTPRMMQFLVERDCPEIEYKAPDPTIYPFPIWVDLQGRLNTERWGTCLAKKYFVPKEEVERIRKPIGEFEPGPRVVCEHMGRLIE